MSALSPITISSPSEEEHTITSPPHTSPQEVPTERSPLSPSPKSPSPNSSTTTPEAPKTPILAPSCARDENKFISAKELNNEKGDGQLSNDDAYENILQKRLDTPPEIYFEVHLEALTMKLIIDELEERGIYGPYLFFKKGDDFYARIDKGGCYRFINVSEIYYRVESQSTQITPLSHTSSTTTPPPAPIKKRSKDLRKNDVPRHYYPETKTTSTTTEEKYFLVDHDEPFEFLGCSKKRNYINKEPIVNKRRRREFGINDDSGEKVNLVKGQEFIVNKRNGDPGIATQGGAFINTKYHNLEIRVTVEATADFSLFDSCSNILGNAVTEILTAAEDRIPRTVIYRGLDRIQDHDLWEARKPESEKPTPLPDDPYDDECKNGSLIILEEGDYHRAVTEWKSKKVQTTIDSYLEPFNEEKKKDEEEKKDDDKK